MNLWCWGQFSSKSHLLSIAYLRWSPQWIICLHLSHPWLPPVSNNSLSCPSLYPWIFCYISLFPHTWQPYIRHSLSSISIFPPLHMSRASQACFSNFVSKPLSCLSDVLISNPVLPGRSQWKSSLTLPLNFLLVWHSPNQTSNQQIKLK